MGGWVCGTWSGLVSEVDRVKHGWLSLWCMEWISE